VEDRRGESCLRLRVANEAVVVGQPVDIARIMLDVAFTSLLKHSNPPPKEWRLGKTQGLPEGCGDAR
jgi:hypothetical protein